MHDYVPQKYATESGTRWRLTRVPVCAAIMEQLDTAVSNVAVAVAFFGVVGGFLFAFGLYIQIGE